jgi:hypothetical protein
VNAFQVLIRVQHLRAQLRARASLEQLAGSVRAMTAAAIAAGLEGYARSCVRVTRHLERSGGASRSALALLGAWASACEGPPRAGGRSIEALLASHLEQG